MRRTTTATAASKPRRKWLRGIRRLAAAAVAYGRRGAEEADTEAERKEREARRLSLDGGSGSRGAGRVRVRQCGKACKELTGLFMTQELPAHSGSVWCVDFSPDGRYLATAGEDRVIHVWEVSAGEGRGELPREGSVTKDNGGPFLAAGSSPEIAAVSLTTCANGDGGCVEKKGRPRKRSSRKSVGSDHLVVPGCVFGFRDKPVCSLLGHADVLDLSWSKSQVRNCRRRHRSKLHLLAHILFFFFLVLLVYILKHPRQ
jgi:WD repeat-containing protein 44